VVRAARPVDPEAQVADRAEVQVVGRVVEPAAGPVVDPAVARAVDPAAGPVEQAVEVVRRDQRRRLVHRRRATDLNISEGVQRRSHLCRQTRELEPRHLSKGHAGRRPPPL
jgi:hypothetical protein